MSCPTYQSIIIISCLKRKKSWNCHWNYTNYHYNFHWCGTTCIMHIKDVFCILLYNVYMFTYFWYEDLKWIIHHFIYIIVILFIPAFSVNKSLKIKHLLPWRYVLQRFIEKIIEKRTESCGFQKDQIGQKITSFQNFSNCRFELFWSYFFMVFFCVC